MEVFRIAKNEWATVLTGSGKASRWNSKNVFMVYTAWSRSLACLEHRVHMRFPVKDFVIATIHIPDSINIEELRADSLPSGWETNGLDGYRICQGFGDTWIKKAKTAVLKVPSAIILEETNFLINPAHGESGKIKVISVKPFSFDSRLF
jgi:RES domain-containing protein